MSISTPLYNQLFSLLSQHSKYRDLRHLKALAWMINPLLCSGKRGVKEPWVVITPMGERKKLWEIGVKIGVKKVKSLTIR